MIARPETKYARSGELHIAYQVVGDGPHEVVVIPGFISHVEFMWESPVMSHFINRLASFTRLVFFDKRGTGMSDSIPVDAMPSLEERMDDVRAVMDAAGVERATLYGVSEGGPMSVLFAATYPDRTHALIIYGGWVRRLRAPDWPHAPTVEEHEALTREFELRWGEAVGAELWAPSLAHLPEFREQWARFLRLAARPGVVGALFRMNRLIDVRGVLPAVRVPTLVIHRSGDRLVPVEQGRYAAKQIPNAKYVELAGDDHLLGPGDVDLVTDEIEEFLTGVRPVPEIDRVLATVLFTDIVGSTERAAALGDHAWRGLLEAHHEIARREVERHRGRVVEFVGDGLLATFDGPARAIRCACAIAEAVRTLGIEIRAGLHTGEVELAGSAVRGIAVHIGARVAAEAAAGEVLVSSTVKDLVAGSGIRFADRGPRALKGVPGEWRLFAAEYQRAA